ncbi:MAG TPA: MFS transporter [bacterium]|nr:MFS transporter [bacterium]
MGDKTAGKIRNVGSMGLGYLVNSAQEISLPLLFPAIKESFVPALTNANLAVIDGVRVIVQTLLSPLWGMASDYYSRKKVLVIGTGLWGGLTILCGFSTNYWHLLASWIIACIGIGALVPAGFSMLADLYGPRERGKAIGIRNALGMSGLVIGALGLGALMGMTEARAGAAPALRADAAWRYGFFAIGGLSILAAAVIAIFIREPARGSAEPELDDLAADLAASQFRFKAEDVRVILRSRTVIYCFLQGFFVLTSLFLLYKFFATWMVEERGFTNSKADLVFGIIIVGLVLGTLVGGVAADRAEQSRPATGRAMVAQFAILMVMPAMAALVTLARGLPAIIACAVVIAFFIEWPRRAALQPMIQNVMAPELRGTALALAEFFQGGLASILLIFLAVYSDRFSLDRAMLFGGCGCLAVAFVCGFGFYRAYPADVARLRENMRQRREVIKGGSTGPG